MNIALYQPEIPQNTAAILRTAACFATPVHIIGPAAFDLSARAVRRAGLDYAQSAKLQLHASFETFLIAQRRVILFTTSAGATLPHFRFAPDDTLLFGRESAGVPDSVHGACAARVRIPIAPGARSLNLSVAVAIGLYHALAATDSLTTVPPT